MHTATHTHTSTLYSNSNGRMWSADAYGRQTEMD